MQLTNSHTQWPPPKTHKMYTTITFPYMPSILCSRTKNIVPHHTYAVSKLYETSVAANLFVCLVPSIIPPNFSISHHIKYRTQLHPSYSPFQILIASPCEQSLITLSAFNHHSIRYLLPLFKPLYSNIIYTPLMPLFVSYFNHQTEGGVLDRCQPCTTFLSCYLGVEPEGLSLLYL